MNGYSYSWRRNLSKKFTVCCRIFWYTSVTHFIVIILNIWEMLIGNHLKRLFLFINLQHVSLLPYNSTIGEAVGLYDAIKIHRLLATQWNYIAEIIFQIVLNILVFLLLTAKNWAIAKSCKGSSTIPKEACLSWYPFEMRFYLSYSNLKVLPSLNEM